MGATIVASKAILVLCVPTPPCHRPSRTIITSMEQVLETVTGREMPRALKLPRPKPRGHDSASKGSARGSDLSCQLCSQLPPQLVPSLTSQSAFMVQVADSFATAGSPCSCVEKKVFHILLPVSSTPQPHPTSQALHQAAPTAAMPVSTPLAAETDPVSMPAILLTTPVSSSAAMQQVLQHMQVTYTSATHMPLHSSYSAALKSLHDIQAMQADLSSPLEGGDDQLQSGETASTSIVSLINLTTEYPLTQLIADVQCGP
ncbi:uncharacterized protein SPSC_03899 [Sporisorium scitamineum]|uniref:Uncharacterized protein n=1 Tax=Sporisorium scitamineum TaxID=49012 RepID=A0A127Z328_9BASI|nr:uncharacterized protein SPSC_03899 [Sporisorium scitamineum]